ncbi:hypothetical protein SAY86_000107 [Trapa natans]|uniref:Uncharacterized protein n=1 Tax=Trapa natans TaxID=22666 RepID=A0AAN7RDP8_TRANT|nr:hypothetical protein SAY86_000107 [Trapa natans]
MSWFMIFLFLVGSAAVRVSGDAGHGSAVVVGTVYCDTCFQQGFSKTSHFLSGASVAVECSNGPIGETYRQEAKTNNLGEFSVNLPFWVGKHVRKIKSCSVELISSNHPNCSVASTASSTSIYLQLHRQGTRIFSAGFFTFKPLKLPNLCNEPSVEVSSSKALIPPNLDPTFLLPLKKLPTIIPPLPGAGLFTPLPFLPKLPPLPQLPPLPSLPSLPKQPPSSPRETTMPRNFNSGSKPDHTASDQKTVNTEFFLPPAPSTFQQQPSFPTNPFKPPPAPLIPLPPIPGLNPTTPPAAFTFQPSFPTNPFQPSPAPLIPLPPIPGMTPTTPPEALTFPFPPFSFPPLTPFRGIPAAATSSSSPSSSPLVTSSP